MREIIPINEKRCRGHHHTFFTRKNKDRRSLLGEQGCGGLCDIERMERMAEITSRPHR